MATSGSINYTQTAAELVKDSLILLGVAHPEEVISTSTENYCLDVLNKMVKAYVGQGIKLWGVQEAAVLFDNDTVKYTFDNKDGSGGKLGVGVLASGLVQTTFSAAEASGQTILSVTSSTGMSASDQIIIELDSGDRDETTIVSVDSATQITVTDALTGAAASGNFIYTFTGTTDEIKHPEQVMNVRLRSSDGTETPMTLLSRQEYMKYVSDKDIEGRPYSYYFDKQLDNPVLYVYSEPDNLKEHIRLDYLRTLEDIDATSDNLYFPDEWLEALTYNLAVRLSSAFGKESKLSVIAPLASQFLDDAMRADSEDDAVSFVVGRL